MVLRSVDTWLSASAFLTILYLSFVGYQRGGVKEISSVIRFGVAVFLAYLFGGRIGEIFGLRGVLGHVVGFYGLFLILFLSAGLIFRHLFSDGTPPGSIDRFFGIILGGIEGLALGLFVAWISGMVPGAPVNSPLSALAGRVIDPLLMNQKGIIPIMKLARDCRNGIDPEKIDMEKVRRETAPIIQNPALRNITDDPVLKERIRLKDFGAVMKDKKIRDLLSDPEFKKSMDSINWDVVVAEIQKGAR
ncbi:MAG: CvpA family protein [Candidatus Riflebacteria bacterium]|nr:CvpA family protein [Candidatus Riflebacteria bacterium]